MIAAHPRDVDLRPFSLRSLPALLNVSDGGFLHRRDNTAVVFAQEPTHRYVLVSRILELAGVTGEC